MLWIVWVAAAIFVSGVVLSAMFHAFNHKSAYVRWGLGAVLLIILWFARDLLLAGIFFSPLLFGGVVFGSYLWRRWVGQPADSAEEDGTA